MSSIRGFSPLNFRVSSFILYSFALKGFELPDGFEKSPSIVQYSFGTNACISFSRSQIIFNATDCTRPAESPKKKVFHKNGLTLYPSILSITRRAICEVTRSSFTLRGLSIASWTPALVISLKSTRWIFLFTGFISPAISAAMASPSLSGSVAMYILSDFFARLFNFSTTSSLPAIIS